MLRGKDQKQSQVLIPLLLCNLCQVSHFACLQCCSKLYGQHDDLTLNLNGIAFNFSKYFCILDLACQGQYEDKQERQPIYHD